MLFLKSWLSDYIDLSGIDDQDLADLISRRSSEVEEVRVITDYYDNKVVVGKITNVQQHPEVDSLKYFDVQLGNMNTTQIVSKATNVREDLLVPVALPGANFAGFVVSSKKLKGIESVGVCLGKSELNLETNYSAGLYELNDIVNDNSLGKSVCEALPDLFNGDTIFDIKILPDKISKIGNHLGMAIEIATVLKEFNKLRKEAKSLTHGPDLVELTKSLDTINIQESESKIELTDTNNYSQSFAMFEVKLANQFELDCKLRRRMFLIGENLTGTIADLSNYIQLDLGQPSHFFKASTLNAQSLEISKTNIEIPFNGLGQLKNTTLPIGVDVLKSKDSMLAIPGVSGSQESSVSYEDTDLVLELAAFDYSKVAKNSFLLNFRSSAAKLYCSEVDQYASILAFKRILEHINPQNIKSKLNYINNANHSFKTWLASINQPLKKNIVVDYRYINDRLGKKNYLNEINSSLPYVGFVESNTIRPFPLVNLVSTQEDITREVSRIIGYDSLENEYITTTTSRIASDQYYNFIRIKELVSSYGFYEIATRPFIHDKKLSLIDSDKTLLQLFNPYREGVLTLRSDLNITLLETLSSNLKDGFKDAKLFEIGKAYYQKDIKVIENNFLGLGLVGDYFNTVTTLTNDILNRLEMSEYSNVTELISLGNKTKYIINDIEVASIIEVSNKVKKMFDLPLNKVVLIINITLPNTINNFPAYKQYKDESQYPSIRRSYSVVVNKDLSTKTIINEILKRQNDFDIYIDPIERIDYSLQDKLLLNIRYTSKDKTLSQDDIQSVEKYLSQYEIKAI